MVFKRINMKRKRKVGSTSPLLDDSPKRTKVHAQRKFAQGSNVNSPVITPIKELESDIPNIDVLPDPVELLPIKRPNTEDFLTFLCFRGTPILPPTLNFFNTASIVDTNGQVHEIKSESPKNGPIDIAKCGSSSEKPFIAFGVRKRADPIVISRQMDRKRRHALALQALRRKYQEQKMAKIRALTISKLSEKVTNKTLVRTNTVSKTETVTKKTNTLQKTKVIATKHVKVTTETLKTTLRPKIKPKMCLRSFRGRFVQKELPFRKRVVPNKTIIKKPMLKKEKPKKKVGNDNASDEEPLATPVKETKLKATTTKVIKKTSTALETSSPRVTRSGISHAKIQVRRQQIKKRILLSNPSTIVKPRSLRSTTMKKTVLSRRKSKSMKAKQKLKAQQRSQNFVANKSSKLGKNLEPKSAEIKKSVTNIKPDIKSPSSKKESVKAAELKKDVSKPGESKKDANKTETKKEVTKSTDIRKSTDIKKSIDIKKSSDIKKTVDVKKTVNVKKTVDVKKSNKISDKDKAVDVKKEVNKSVDIKEEVNKAVEVKKEIRKTVEVKKEISKPVDMKKEVVSKSVDIKKEKNKDVDIKKSSKSAIKKEVNSRNVTREVTKLTEIKKELKNIEVIVDKPSDIKKDLSICEEQNKKEVVKSYEIVKKVNSKIVENKIVSSSLPTEKVKKDEKFEETLEKFKNKVTRNDNSNLDNLTESSNNKKGPSEVTAKKETTKKDDQLVKTKEISSLEKSKNKTTKNDNPNLGSLTKASNNKNDTSEVTAKKETTKKDDRIVKAEEISILEKSKNKITKSDNLNLGSLTKASNNKKDLPEVTTKKESTKKDEQTVKAEEILILEKSKNKITNNDNSNLGNLTKASNSKKDTFEVTTAKETTKKDDQIVKAEETSILEKSKKKIIKNDNSTLDNLAKVYNNKKDTLEITTKKETTKMDDQIRTDEKDKSANIAVRKEIPNKGDITDINVKIDIHNIGKTKSKKEPPKKEAVVIRKEDMAKKKEVEKLEEHSVPKMAQRPSRKTKEAAAIYMEILSHKLVNESKIDDDNISIDSFPELPNVKKTEQRENELKAQARSTKDDYKEKIKTDSSECEESDMLRGKNHASKSLDENSIHKQKNKKTCNEDIVTENVPNMEKINTSENFGHAKQEIGDDAKQPKQNKTLPEAKSAAIRIGGKSVQKNQLPIIDAKKVPVGKRKLVKEEKLIQDIDSVNDAKKLKAIKPENAKPVNKPLESKVIKKDIIEATNDKDVLKRKTRHSSHGNKKEDTADSDESFHIDIKLPKKKKLTRSKTPKILKIDYNIEKVNIEPKVAVNTKTTLKHKEDPSSSDSDHSTTSDIVLQTLKNKAKNKKFSKTKSMKKTEVDFSDSDEEPLSKLTNRSIEGSQKSTIPFNKEISKQEVKVKETAKSTAKSKSTTKTAVKTPEVNREVEGVKPKRECAKRPQNYLPMLSSSDEDDIFHGFDKKTEEKNSKPVPAVEANCTHAPPLLDLLNKDIGRRFGKEKVNMSNEQIEKWLKDSALAGSSIKKENDEMLKFGERIPTETTLETVEHIDTQKLKCSLLEPHEEKKQSTEDISVESPSAPVKKFEKVELASNSQIKPHALDRKLIFRKSKKDAAPNINAFSPENESSVYAFGEENEETISTPFRRPSRRPSSTATSRSEDESSKHDDSLKAGHFRKPTLKQDVVKSNKEDSDVNIDIDESSHHFYIPQKPTKHNFSKFIPGSNLNKLKLENKTILKIGKSSDRFSESDDFKYKIPSSPSASSSSSAKLYKRQTQKQKVRPPEFLSPVYLSDFPKKTDPAKLVEAPVFHPTDQEFQDPLEYIERIRHKAEQFGICRIVPPSSFKPECKVTDDMRFTAYNQYIHKMLHRWGPNFKELMAIKKYLETQNISLTQPPWIGGMEIDLPRLYQTVQTLGGLKEVIEKKKWPRVSELMKIPRSAQDRVTKLDDIYCKYLLPYDTLSPAEREKLFDEVETEWAKRESKTLLKAQQKLVSGAASEVDSEPDDVEVEECITKGRNMALNAFYRIARNTMSMYFKTTEPAPQEVEQEYWKYVTMRQNHICVHSGSIDSGSWGYGFAVSKNSPFARHAWNLKVLTNNNGSVLRSLGPIMGVTVPTLHVGMVFSACCWYRDPHGLPWIEYLHTGGSKIWYGIPNSTSDLFHSTLKKLVPNYCKNKELCLPSDTVMVPPNLLVENNLSLCRTVQDPGQFVVVFPKAFTSSISTGYVVSESVYFAPPYWLKTARNLFDALRNSREPSMFSLDRLILSMASDSRCNPEILRLIIPHVQELCDKEKERRVKLQTFGTMEQERMPLPEANNRKRKKLQGEEGDYECEICRMNLFVSMVFDTQETVTYCLDHGIEMIESNKSNVSNCKFMFAYDDEELDGLSNKLKLCIENKQLKKVPNKYAGMPTLLTK